MASGDGSGADGDGADIPDAHRFLSSVSRSDLARQLRARGLPVPADLLHSLTDAPGDGEAIPYVHEFLSQASLAWVAAGMRDAGRPVPSGIHPAAAGEGIPFVHDLLSGASLAYVAHGLAAEGREVASGLRAALGRLKQVDPRIAAATATAAAAPAGPPGEGSGGRFPERIGPYRLIRRLGKGGMGTVYACRREDGDETLAIKVINAGRLADPADRLRFKQEIAVLLRLRHEHVCRLRDFGQEGDSYWFVMDFVDGREIDEWCKAERPDQARIATVMAQVCRAVGHAHRQGIVHRDLTPANIMITGDGRPVVMDFGLARDMDAGPSMTITGMTVGTPPFMAPEQTMGKAGSITRTTDVWGAGATLYFLLTGVPPHQGDNTFEVFKAINERMVRRPRELRADIDPSLELVILSCLQQDPRDRYRDMDSLARDLEEIAAGRRVRVRLPGFVTTMGRRIRRHPLPWMLTIALAGTGIGFLTYVASQQIREWGAWTSMGTYRAGAPLPAGLMALDHTLAPRDMPPPQPDGLPYIGDPSNYQRGWWWLEAPGMDGDLRISAEFTLITPDTMEFAIGATRDPMRDWWHHPAGWGLKFEAKDQPGVSARYFDRPGPLLRSQLRLTPGADPNRLRLRIERRDTVVTVQADDLDPVVFEDPLAVGGGRGFGIRFFQPDTRLRWLKVERLALGERVLPVAAGDGLVRRGRFADAVTEYRTVAEDHRSPAIAGPALLRALAAACRTEPPDEALIGELLVEIGSLRDPGLLARGQRIRAVWLWSQGRHAQAVGAARDIIAMDPRLNPFPAFMSDGSRDLSAPLGAELLRLSAQSPPLGRIGLPDAGLTDLHDLPPRPLLELAVPGNRISDLGPLRELGLRRLEAEDNLIADLGPFAGSTTLQHLFVAGNRIEDIRPLAGVAGLTSLDLSRNPLRSLAGLPPRVTQLRLGGTQVQDLAPLAGRPVEQLDLWDCPVTDLAPLADLPTLQQVTLAGIPVPDLTPLGRAPLSSLAVRRMPLDLSRLPHWTRLRELSIEEAGCTDAALLPDRLPASLRQLSLYGNPFTGFPRLELPALTMLQLGSCGLESMPAIDGMPALRQLGLRGNRIAVADALAGRRLEQIDLRDNRLTDPTPLLATPADNLLLRGNPLCPAGIRALMERGLESGRLDLYWQGVSAQLGGAPDPDAWRRHAIPVGRQRYAVAYTNPITATAAAAFARACGGVLGAPEGPAAADLIERSVNRLESFWIGATWTGDRIVDPDGRPWSGAVDLAWFPLRRQARLPARALPISISQPARWCLRNDGLAEGLVIRFDPR